MDLGCAMLRRWWRPVMAVWLVVYLPVAVLLHLAFQETLIYALLALWWLKPLFDRAVLHVLGGAVFGDVPRLGEALRTLPGALRPGLLASLTYYRLDLARSFNLPVWHLERLRGHEARERAKALHRRARGHAVWLTLMCLAFELVMRISLLGLIGLLTPAPYEIDVSFAAVFFGGGELPLWQQWLTNIFYVVAVSVVEPFYVAAGFALYLNRRTQLEAWDIELALRRLEERAAAALRRGAPLAAAVLLALSLAAAPPPALGADSQREPATVIKEVLAEPEFSQHKDVKRLRYTGRGLGLDPGADRKSDTKWDKIGKIIAEIGRVLMWAAAGALVAAALYLAGRYWRRWGGGVAPAYSAPQAMFGLDIRPESLPPDIPAAALDLMQKGRMREALSLLYRGALSALVHRDRIELVASDTEGDCLRRVTGLGRPELAGYFGALIAAWQSAAYAGRTPERAPLEALCRAWAAHFAAAPRT
jgi:hypothetical protein